eukprot:3637899-Amphidinium_carterae.2
MQQECEWNENQSPKQSTPRAFRLLWQCCHKQHCVNSRAAYVQVALALHGMDAPVGTWFYARDDAIGCDIIKEGPNRAVGFNANSEDLLLAGSSSLVPLCILPHCVTGNAVMYKEGDKQYKNAGTGEFFFLNERTARHMRCMLPSQRSTTPALERNSLEHEMRCQVKLDYKQDDGGVGWWQSTAEGGLRLRIFSCTLWHLI